MRWLVAMSLPKKWRRPGASPKTNKLELLTVRDGDGKYSALFELGTLEGARMLGFLIHVPGHWVAITPACLGSVDHIGMVCDSLFDCVFHITGADFAEFLEAMAIKAIERDGVWGAWSAYRVSLYSEVSSVSSISDGGVVHSVQ